MNILLLSRATYPGASSRLRTLQYLPFLAREGIHVQVAPLVEDASVHARRAGQPGCATTARFWARRLKQIRTRPRPDLVWLENEALPWLPWLIEKAALPRGVPVVCDCADADYHRYDHHKNKVVRAVLGRKIGKVMGAASLVVAGNDHLAGYARRAKAPWVETVPTVVDLDHYPVRVKPDFGAATCVGWIGTPDSWRSLAEPVHAMLDPLLASHQARFLAVGASLSHQSKGTLVVAPWREQAEAAMIQSMDIGIMPLDDTPWARGDCGYKLLQFMACGLPVVASPVGVNSHIVTHGETGFLAQTPAEWRAAITLLLQDSDLRQRMGEAGRRKVEQAYALERWGPRVAGMMRYAAKTAP